MEKIKVISIVIKHRYDVIDAGYCGLDMIVMAVLGVILFFFGGYWSCFDQLNDGL